MASSSQRKACRSKKKYVDQASAQKRANNLWGKGIRLKVYKCSICDGWHLSKISRKLSLELAFEEATKFDRKLKKMYK